MPKKKMKNEFNKIYKASAIASIIQNTKEHSNNVLGWKLIDGKKIISHLHLRVNKPYKSEFILCAKRKEEVNQLREILSSEGQINIFFPDDFVLFQCEVIRINHSNTEIAVNYPKMMAQIDRRRSLRYEVSCKDKVLISLKKNINLFTKNEQFFNKTVRDLSCGGVAFTINRGERHFFKKNDYFEEVVIELNGKKHLVSASIIHCLETKPSAPNNLSYPEYRISLKFDSIEEKSINEINEFIIKKIDFQKDVS